MANQDSTRASLPVDVEDRAWAIMQQWQDFVHESPDNECVVALFVLMADMLLRNMAYTKQWTAEQTLLNWYQTLVPHIVSHVEKHWEAQEEV